MNFTKYEKYKDSGVEWLGEIPEDWEIKRVKDYALSNCKSLGEKTDGDFEIQYIDISSVEIGGIVNNPELLFFKDAPSRARRMIRKNDVIISTVRTYLKAVAYFENTADNLICSTGFSVLSPRKTIYPTFLKYVILSENFIDKVICNSKGVSYPAINNSELIALSFITPSLKQQTAIAEYLDEKTVNIDKKIELLQTKKEKYRELRKTLINETITKGIDKTIELKDSGVNWLGELPKHWEVKRIKDLFKLVTDAAANDNDHQLLSIYTNIGVKPREDMEQRGNKSTTTDGYWIVKKGDFIVNKLLAWMGAIGLSDYDGVTSPAYDILRKKKIPLVQKYYEYLFRLEMAQAEFKRNSRGIMEVRLRLYFDKFGAISVPVPSFDEQQKIVEYLDEKTSKIDAIITTIDKNIKTLNEFRKTLINDAVTGKIKVV